jgi:TnpA family transposase
MIYWHVERKSVCIYSQLKHCSASEVAAMIEAVLRHCTDAEIDRNYVDTHGASVSGSPSPTCSASASCPGSRTSAPSGSTASMTRRRTRAWRRC